VSRIHFYKYQAAGNDFVVIDNRARLLKLSKEQIMAVCDRRFGVGADGVMLLEKHPSLNFNLEYFNCDGSQSLCGNGSRAAMHFASSLGMVNGKGSFNAYDGPHSAEILSSGLIKLMMNPVSEVKVMSDDYFMNTGSPHFIRFVKYIDDYPVYEEGKRIRFDDFFKPGGTNVNFVELLADNTIYVRTYERGVENETLSCGTGVTAAALAASLKNYTSPVKVRTLGGELSVEFKSARQPQSTGQAGTFSEIYLIGPAKMVFEGDLEL
jgi:diaminopimelate epimerase